jgi:hypothetical protein
MTVEASSWAVALCCKTCVSRVDSRGFEPLASAVQSYGIIVDVSRGPKMPANKPVLPLESCRPCLSLFVWVGALVGVLRVRGGGGDILRVVGS